MKVAERTAHDLFVHEHIFNGCTHDGATMQVNHREDGIHGEWSDYYALCPKCGKWNEGSNKFHSNRSVPDPVTWLRADVPGYCTDIILARDVVRMLERRGWRLEWRRENDNWTFQLRRPAHRVLINDSADDRLSCFASRDIEGVVIQGETKPSELEGIVSVLMCYATHVRASAKRVAA